MTRYLPAFGLLIALPSAGRAQQPAPGPEEQREVAASGISDLTTSFFFSPSKPKRLVWGVGPVIVPPSTSEPTFGSGKWSAGPTLLLPKKK